MNWEPIKNAPIDGRNLWVCYWDSIGHAFQTEAWWDKRWKKADNCEAIDNVTHWMYLPPAPRRETT